MTISGGAGVFEEFTNDRNGTEKWNLVYILAFTVVHKAANGHGLTIRNGNNGGSLTGKEGRNGARTGGYSIAVIQGTDFCIYPCSNIVVRGGSRLDMELNAVFTPGDGNITVFVGSRQWNLATYENFGFLTAHGGNIRSGKNPGLSLFYKKTELKINVVVYMGAKLLEILTTIEAAKGYSAEIPGFSPDSTAGACHNAQILGVSVGNINYHGCQINLGRVIHFQHIDNVFRITYKHNGHAVGLLLFILVFSVPYLFHSDSGNVYGLLDGI